jgi:pimeloyl-ACP methyl ester carboxylesterase
VACRIGGDAAAPVLQAKVELAERESWAAANQRGRHMRIPGTGHWLQLEKPELVASVIQDILR